jgi:hypothetical protein
VEYLQYVRHPVRAADYIFKSRGWAFDEEALGTAHWDIWRNRIGAAILLAVAAAYGGLGGVANHYEGVVQAVGVEIVTLTGLCLLIGLGLLIFTHRESRRRSAPYLALPFGVCLAALATFAALFFVSESLSGPVMRDLLLLPLKLYAAIYVLVFSARALYLCVTGLCRAADAHPLFGPVMSPLFAAILAVISLFTNSPSGNGPTGLLVLALLWGGPISLTMLSAAQIRALREHFPRQFPFREP